MSKIDPRQSVKRPCSSKASASESRSKKRSREPVVILKDAWFEALKFLACLKWSKMRPVSRQLNGVVQRNVSRLPLAIIDNAAMRLIFNYSTRQRKENEVKIIVSDSAITPEEQEQWFKDSGITIDLPGDVQLSKSVIGAGRKENCCVDLSVLGPAQGDELTQYERACPWFFGQQIKAEVLFFAEFRPYCNKYSSASMAFFLKLLYDQSTFVKELSMYTLDTKLKDFLFLGKEERYIRCGSFTLQVTPGYSVEGLCESVSWLEQNVQADKVQFSNEIRYDDSEICDAMSNYLLGSTWISASQVVNLGEINDAERFFGVLIKKFPIAAVQSIFPTVVFCGYHPLCCDSLNNQLSGKWIVKEKLEHPEEDSDDSQSDETYTISNGSNRIRIEFIRLIRRIAKNQLTYWYG